MPTGIHIPQGIVEHIRVAVEALGIARPRHNRIRRDEAAQLPIVPAGVVARPETVEGKLNPSPPGRVLSWYWPVKRLVTRLQEELNLLPFNILR